MCVQRYYECVNVYVCRVCVNRVKGYVTRGAGLADSRPALLSLWQRCAQQGACCEGGLQTPGPGFSDRPQWVGLREPGLDKLPCWGSQRDFPGL